MGTACALAVVLTVLAGSPARATEADERRGRFNELARRYAATTDPAEDLLAGLLDLVDREVVDSLTAGGPFASAAFIQERLDAFADDWGGVSFLVVQPEAGERHTVTLLLVTLTRAEPRGALRVYGRADNEVSLVAGSAHDGTLALHPWPRAGNGVAHVLVSWAGTSTGRGSRFVRLELWRVGPAASATRAWSSDDAFPEGLWALDFRVARGQISVRRELHYPGWTPGCVVQTEEEDVYGQARPGAPVTLVRRRVWNAWHRELHAAVARFFVALGAGDARSLAELVPDRAVRARVPRTLEPEPACDEPGADAASVIVAAAARDAASPPRPWALRWHRTPQGWRLAAADAVLE